MASFGNTQYNPASVMLGSGSGGPYLKSGSGGITGGPIMGGTAQFPGVGGTAPVSGGGTAPTQSTNVGGTAQVPQVQQLNPESVRATGSGPFDSAYRQNLATYAGGQFERPGGNLSFNPTSSNLFGNPTGGGNDPVLGMGNSLLSLGLGGQPAAFNTPQPQTTNPTMGGNQLGGSLMDWLRQLRGSNGLGSGNAGANLGAFQS